MKRKRKMSEYEEEELSERTRKESKAWPTNKRKTSQTKTSSVRVKEQETSNTTYIG